MELKQLMGKIDLFEGLDEKILEKLADEAIKRKYPKDEPIVKQNETGLGLYVISKGRVRVEANGKKVAELKEEQSFAEMSIIDNQPRSATVLADEDTECLLLTRDKFVKLMQKHPEIPIRLARVLAARLREANQKLTSMGAEPPPPTPVPVDVPAAPSAEAPAASSNGAAPPAATGMKASVQDTLLGVFSKLYTMKAFTRFSVAVLGCPVEGVAPSAIGEIRIGEVKALVLPDDPNSEMRIAASEPGEFTLHLFRPEADSPVRWGHVGVDPAADCRLRLGRAGASLTSNGRVIAPDRN